MSNPAISGPGKCKIWNLGIKISKITKFELIEMKGFEVSIFPMLTSKYIETHEVKSSTVRLLIFIVSISFCMEFSEKVKKSHN